jgi:phospholipid:diacylglycerol acyltransferase
MATLVLIAAGLVSLHPEPLRALRDPLGAGIKNYELLPENEEFKLLRQNLTAHHPIVIIPGIISTGLEVWQAKACAKQYFRGRLWGSSTMLTSTLLDMQCWLEHIMLNHTTGDDPDRIKLRPASGFGAADFFISDYWVWAPFIKDMADIDYTPNNMFFAAYDWRLSYDRLESRDAYFSRLKTTIEMLRETNGGRKAVLVAHSMGALVAHYFLKWHVVTNNCI